MAFYTMKIFDRDGRLVGRSEFRASRDDDAAATMHYLYRGRPFELWCGTRKIANWANPEDGSTVEIRGSPASPRSPKSSVLRTGHGPPDGSSS